MNKLYLCLVFISLSALCYSDDSSVDGTELLLTFLVHRHGDRTPVQSTLRLTSDAEALSRASAKYGYGQLTDVGRRRGYELGQFIRRRYDSLLSPHFNKSEIYIRSTDSTRTKMTVLSAMAAVYPATQDNWNEDVNWTPVPYTTVPAKYDFNLAYVNCPVFINYIEGLKTGESRVPYPEKYSEILQKWSEIVGVDVPSQPSYPYLLNDVYTSQINLGIPLDPKIEALYPEIEEIAAIAMDYIFGDERYIAMQAGGLLNQFFIVADKIVAGEQIPRVQVYSAHDQNVFTLEAATQISPRQGVPKYGSAYALELRKVVDSGEYIVVPVYLNTPSEDVVVYPQVSGCGVPCDLESFRDITSKYTIDEEQWRIQCEWSEHFDVDTAGID